MEGEEIKITKGTPPNPTEKVEDNELHKDSGLFSIINNFIGDEETDIKKTVESQEGEKPVGSIEEGSEAPPVTPSNEGTDGASTSENSTVIEGEDLNIKLEEMDKTALIEEIKKNQRLLSDTQGKVKEFETKYADLESKTKGISESDAVQALELLAQDFKGNYEKIQKKFKLPSIDLVTAQFNGSNSIGSRLKQYQENILKSKIEKEYNLADGEFEYDPKEASQANTPSFDWDFYTNKKKQELIDEQTKIENASKSRLEKLEQQQKEDIKWYAQKYTGGDEAKVQNFVTKMSEIATKAARGEESYEKHPYSLRNLLRGFFHEDLVKNAVTKAIKDLESEYAKHNLYLPGKSTPTDVTNLQASPGQPTGSQTSEEELQRSPMLRSLRY